jgi:hypothetical protein
MTQDDDRLLHALVCLPPIAPDVEWEARLRARCRSAVSRRASRRARAAGNLLGAELIDLAAATALCVYLATVLMEASRLGISL